MVIVILIKYKHNVLLPLYVKLLNNKYKNIYITINITNRQIQRKIEIQIKIDKLVNK